MSPDPSGGDINMYVNVKPHFYIVKMGFTGLYQFFSFLIQNTKLHGK